MKNVKPEKKTMAEQLAEAQARMNSVRSDLADERFVKPDEINVDTQRADAELAERLLTQEPPEVVAERNQEIHEVRLEQAQAETDKVRAETKEVEAKAASLKSQAWTGYAIAALTGVAAVAVGWMLIKGSKPLPETRV